MKDSHFRSLIKGITWRITGTVDTIIVSFFVTGSIKNSLMIGASEVITKIFLYYFHERIWNAFTWQRTPDGPSHIRSFVKGISWRALGTIDTIILSLLITQNLNGALMIGGTELFTKIILYYIHERIWSSTKWGRIKKENGPVEVPEIKIITPESVK